MDNWGVFKRFSVNLLTKGKESLSAQWNFTSFYECNISSLLQTSFLLTQHVGRRWNVHRIEISLYRQTVSPLLLFLCTCTVTAHTVTCAERPKNHSNGIMLGLKSKHFNQKAFVTNWSFKDVVLPENLTKDGIMVHYG